MKTKQGNKRIKENNLMDEFTEIEGWMCNDCGVDLPDDFRDLQEHLEIVHGYEVVK